MSLTLISRQNVLGFAALFLSCAPLVAQQSPPTNEQENPLVFRSTVNRVIVDVIVTDSQGKPVTGLSEKDFSVAEDRKRQKVLSFDVHDFDNDTPSISKLPPLPPNTFVNIATTPERGPLYVLLLDLVNTGTLPDQMWGRQQLLNFVKSKPEGTRFAVFCLSDGLHLVQGFTSDRQQIYDAVNPWKPKPHVPKVFLYSRVYGAGDPLLMISVFTDIALYLDGLPGRKNLIWLADDFPVQMFPSDDAQNVLPDLHNQELKVVDALTRSETSVYPISLAGVEFNPAGALTGGTPSGGATSVEPLLPAGTGEVPRGSSAPGGPIETAMRAAGSGSSLAYNYAVADEIASLTGGRASYSTNDVTKALNDDTEMGAHYYTLTYSSSNKNYHGKLRTIQVSLKKKGYYLFYRRAYYGNGDMSPIIPMAHKPGERQTRPIGDSLSANMHPGAPVARQILFRIHVQPVGPPALATSEQMANLAEQPAYFKNRKKNRPAKPLSPIELQTYLVDYTVVGGQPNLEVAAAVYDSEGTMLNGDVEEASSVADSGSPSSSSYFRIEQRIDVPLKAKTMRFAVRDTATDKVGAMEIPLPLKPEPPQTSLSGNSNASQSPAKTN